VKPPETLAQLLEGALSALRAAEPSWEGGRAVPLCGEIERIAAVPATAEPRRAALRALAAELRSWFKSSAANSKENDGFCNVELTGGALRAYLTVFPPRRGGAHVGSEECFRELDLHQVNTGLDSAAVRRAVAVMQETGDVVYAALVAEGRTPGEPKAASVEFSVPRLVKDELRLDTKWLLTNLPKCLHELREGQPVGRHRPGSPGDPGVTVRGKMLPPTGKPEGEPEWGPSLHLAHGAGAELVAASPGQLIIDRQRLSVIPLFLVEGDYAPPSPEISFRGLVVVLGNLTGLKVDADEVIIAGNCERSEIHSAGDVLIGGGVAGKREGKIFADGRVATRHVTDAEIEALGDVVVTNSITYSNVTSNSRIKVTAERGAIVGGRVAALKGIEARSVGSDFGTYTVTAVGRDFLTAKRLERLKEVIRGHEDNLAKITALKDKLAKHNVDVRRLPPEKQDIYLGVLRKEARSRMELEGLLRRRDRVNAALSDVLEAAIKIREELYPPVRVEIADAIREIEQRLRGVVVYRDRKEGILTRSASPEEAGGDSKTGR
jgi:uncharacterized protein (DUF342 family)